MPFGKVVDVDVISFDGFDLALIVVGEDAGRFILAPAVKDDATRGRPAPWCLAGRASRSFVARIHDSPALDPSRRAILRGMLEGDAVLTDD